MWPFKRIAAHQAARSAHTQPNESPPPSAISNQPWTRTGLTVQPSAQAQQAQAQAQAQTQAQQAQQQQAQQRQAQQQQAQQQQQQMYNQQQQPWPGQQYSQAGTNWRPQQQAASYYQHSQPVYNLHQQQYYQHTQPVAPSVDPGQPGGSQNNPQPGSFQQPSNQQMPQQMPFQQQMPAQHYQQPQQGAVSSSWTVFFTSDMTPTPCFVELVQALFSHLDTQRTGLWTPEMYAAFADAQGVPSEHNIWRHAYDTASGHREGVADSRLKTTFDSFSIDHNVATRTTFYGQPASSSASPMGFLGSLFGGNAFGMPGTTQMPLLTLRGLIDLMTIELLADPSTAWGNANRAMRTYRLLVWRERGDAPRWVVPAMPVPAMVNRVQQVGQQAVQLANMAVDTQARLNLTAVNAIGGTQYRFRDY